MVVRCFQSTDTSSKDLGYLFVLHFLEVFQVEDHLLLFRQAMTGSKENLLGEIPVWVYVDEYSASSSDGFSKDTRRARVRVGFKDRSGETLYYQDYTISQRAVYPVKISTTLSTKTYGMEFHEEYLYNYDRKRNQIRSHNRNLLR